MYNISKIFWTLLLCLPIWAEEPEEIKLELILHQNKEKGYSIEIPKNWEKKEEQMGTSLIVISPEEGFGDDFKENLIVVVENLKKEISLENYLALNLKSLESVFKQFKLQEKGDITINSHSGKYLIYTYEDDGFPIKILAYLFVKNRRGYAITCGALDDSFNDYRKIFEQLSLTFKLE